MSPEFVQCGYCKARVPLEQCAFAAHRASIDGKEYVFCCAQCAEQFKAKKKKKK
jgi:YHS domain-containing protein